MHVKYGGVRFSNNVPPEEINRFVRSLPVQDRDSLFEVISILSREGLITIHEGDSSTFDVDQRPFMEPAEPAD